MGWYAFKDGKSIGQTGSESGLIIQDEEHDRGARITLERRTQHAPFAITCGIYGWMVHTRRLDSEVEARSDFDSMKNALSEILDIIPLADAPHTAAKTQTICNSISAFVETYP